MLPFIIITILLTTSGANGASLWVPTTPQSPRPYALKKGDGIKLAGGNTFPVTGNSSGNAFCILNTNAGSSGGTGVFPHVHKKTYENFYAVKGRVQLWGQNLDTYKANTSIQQSRILAQGDIGAIPFKTIHTFSLLEPDTQLTGGGTTLPGSGGFNISELADWDVYPQLDFVPRRDVVNGKAGPGNWYDGPNDLPDDHSAPIWVAKNYGPKWLNSDGGRYQIVAPFVRGHHTNGTFSQGTVTISPSFSSEDVAPLVRSEVATAFMMEEGQLEVLVDGYEPASLIDGDVVFVPANTSFSYVATAQFTKFMYVTGGGRGLDYELITAGKPWDSAFYPQDEQVGMSHGRMVRI